MKDAGSDMNRLQLRRDKEGQASVIGTIMAIMIMLAFLSLITTQYVPITMTEYEAQHMNTVISEFANLRQNMDNLIITRQTSMGMFSTVTLGSSNVPVFSAPTASRLSFVPPNTTFGYSEVAFDTSNFGAVNEVAAGSVDIGVPNRYYIPQTVFYENAAIIVRQESGQSVRAKPHFNAEVIGGRVHLSISLIYLVGVPSGLTGTGAVGVQTFLQATNTWQYDNITSNVTYTVSTRNTQAWKNIFDTTLHPIGSVNYNITPPGSFDKYSTGADGYGIITVNISNVETVVLTTSTLSVKIGSD